MSMTKRYLESLPTKEQDDILGLGPQDDEWTDSADNEPAGEKLRKMPGLEWLDRMLTDETGDIEC